MEGPSPPKRSVAKTTRFSCKFQAVILILLGDLYLLLALLVVGASVRMAAAAELRIRVASTWLGMAPMAAAASADASPPEGMGRQFVPSHATADCLSDLLQRAEASDEVSRRSLQPCRFTMASTHTGT
jgi:hypothetical protein